jgi:uncharacterized protein (DUF302 family)
MNPMTTGMIIGLIAGILSGWLVVFFALPALMFRESRSPSDFNATVTRIEKLVAERGWKIPAVHDLRATLKNFGKDVMSVKVLEICNPELAFRVLGGSRERIVSNMMPCRIAVYEKADGSVWISRMNAGVVSRSMRKTVRKTMAMAARDMEEIIADVVQE